MVTLSARFDGKAIVLDDPARLSLPSGTRVKVSVEAESGGSSPTIQGGFVPLHITVDPDISDSIALDPEFNIEES